MTTQFVRMAAVNRFREAFTGEINSLAALYRQASADAMEVLSRASATVTQRMRAEALLEQYQRVLAGAGDEAAAWIEMNIPRAYRTGMEFAENNLRGVRRAGINLERRGERVLGRREAEVFATVHREAVSAIVDSMLTTTNFALAQIGRRVGDVFRSVGVEEVAKGIVEGKTRIDVSRDIRDRLLAEGKPFFVDKSGRRWDLDRYSEMVARTTTREAMTQGTINRLREEGVGLVQVSAHNAADFCIYYENAVVSINGPHPVYPPISAIDGGPPFHCNCAHALTPFIERLATPEELERGRIDPDRLNQSPAEMQKRFREQFPERARAEGQRIRRLGVRRAAKAQERQAEYVERAKVLTRGKTKGGYAANGLTVTQIGYIGEAAAEKFGFDRFPGALDHYNRPCDFKQANYAVEVKTFTSMAKEKRIRIVPAAMERKQRFAAEQGLQEKMVTVVLSRDLGSAEIYQRERFGNWDVGTMQYLGRVRGYFRTGLLAPRGGA